jgi:hypothetical protein
VIGAGSRLGLFMFYKPLWVCFVLTQLNSISTVVHILFAYNDQFQIETLGV